MGASQRDGEQTSDSTMLYGLPWIRNHWYLLDRQVGTV